jgi:putative ABC transport system ATP-binding protein
MLEPETIHENYVSIYYYHFTWEAIIMPEPIIVANNIIKVFLDAYDSEFTALHDLNLQINEGERLGITGASGSGKTTLLSILGCLEKPTSGTLTIYGRDTGNMNDEALSQLRLREIGFIFQEHNLIPALTIRENIELPLTLMKKPKKEREARIGELLKIVDLENLVDRYPSQLSRGQRQRIAAVRALANEPKIIIGDEPTSDLDKQNAGILLDFLKKINQQTGTTLILAATDREAFQGITSRELRLEDGEIRK